ncbi:hypothetical protein V2J09_001874 [Rumex salicifolius]
MAEQRPPPDQTLDSSSTLADQPVDSGSASELRPLLVRTVSGSRLNAKAPEFVPGKTPPASRQSTPPPMLIAPPPPPPPPIVHVFPQHPPFHVAIPPPQSHIPLPHIHHQQGQQQFHQPPPQPPLGQHHQYHSGHHSKHHGQLVGGGGEQSEAAVQGQQAPSQSKDHGNGSSSNGLSDEATQKIINQVEYYFSDINLATTDHLIRFMNKDSGGYVPISVVSSFKKIKALVSSNSQLADVLRNSTKLVVSEDGKKVKRRHPLTGPDMEELQCRIIVSENLPEDHCYQNLMKVFSSVGSVKSIRTCQPQAVNTGASSAARQSKVDNMLHSNKLHAFVEYDSIELAEKAVLELNDEANWRNGLRVRLLLKRSSKSQQARGKKAGNGGESSNEEEGVSTLDQNHNDGQQEDQSGETELLNESVGEEQSTEKEGGGQKKARNHRVRGKGRGRGQNHQNNNRGAHHIGSPPISLTLNNTEHVAQARPPPGPRMPDGTRGFSMGRGKPVSVNTA